MPATTRLGPTGESRSAQRLHVRYAAACHDNIHVVSRALSRALEIIRDIDQCARWLPESVAAARGATSTIALILAGGRAAAARTVTEAIAAANPAPAAAAAR